jgi:hypothetical protein
MLAFDKPSGGSRDPGKKTLQGPVRLTSRLVSKRWPSEESLAERLGAQVRALLAMRAGSTADPWPYHPLGKLQFAHVRHLPLLVGQMPTLRPTVAPPQPSLSTSDVNKMKPASVLTTVYDNDRDDASNMRDTTPAAAAARYIRKTDPGVRDMRTSTWMWTDDEAEEESARRRVGVAPTPETWMLAQGRERNIYRFNMSEALQGELLFRPRRLEDRTNVTCGLPIASPRAIVATSAALRSNR